MTKTRYAQVAAGILVIALGAWGASRAIDRIVLREPAGSAPPASGAAAPAVPHITATLFYATADGRALAAVRREVPLAEGARAQGKQILESQLEDAPAPYLSVIPRGTMLRAFYVTERGDAFVDLSPEISTAHPGGTTNELLTVYAIVNAVTANLPSIQRVQILVGGKESDTLAGHVDMRRPFERDTSLVREEQKTTQ